MLTRRSLGALTAAALARPALAQTWPPRDLTGIIMWGAGGATDVVARALTPHVEAALGAKIVLQNRPGGVGAIATQAVHAAPADGLTLLYGAENPQLHKVLGLAQIDYAEFFPVNVIARGVGGRRNVAALATVAIVLAIVVTPTIYVGTHAAQEAMALYGVSGVAVSTSWIIQCLSGQLEAEDAQLFAGLREDFYFNGCDRSDYVLERMGISASIEERAKLRLEIQRKKEAYWAAVASEVVGVEPGRDVLWRPYLAEREQLNQEYDALGSRWVILEQKYVDLLKEQDPFGKDHHEREEATRTALQKEYENLQVDNGEWDRRYAELLDKVHSDANYDRIIEETRKSLHELETRENKVRLRRQGQEALVPPGR